MKTKRSVASLPDLSSAGSTSAAGCDGGPVDCTCDARGSEDTSAACWDSNGQGTQFSSDSMPSAGQHGQEANTRVTAPLRRSRDGHYWLRCPVRSSAVPFKAALFSTTRYSLAKEQKKKVTGRKEVSLYAFLKCPAWSALQTKSEAHFFLYNGLVRLAIQTVCRQV